MRSPFQRPFFWPGFSERSVVFVMPSAGVNTPKGNQRQFEINGFNQFILLITHLQLLSQFWTLSWIYFSSVSPTFIAPMSRSVSRPPNMSQMLIFDFFQMTSEYRGRLSNVQKNWESYIERLVREYSHFLLIVSKLLTVRKTFIEALCCGSRQCYSRMPNVS